MSKELTPLEAFEILKQDIGACYKEETLIVEKELKAQEQYVQIAEKEHEDYMVLCGEITRLKNKHKKELKALEIIKKKDVFVWGFIHRQEEIEDFEWTYDYYKTHYGYFHSGGDYEILTEEEFNLLKEVLL